MAVRPGTAGGVSLSFTVTEAVRVRIPTMPVKLRVTVTLPLASSFASSTVGTLCIAWRDPDGIVTVFVPSFAAATKSLPEDSATVKVTTVSVPVAPETRLIVNSAAVPSVRPARFTAGTLRICASASGGGEHAEGEQHERPGEGVREAGPESGKSRDGTSGKRKRLAQTSDRDVGNGSGGRMRAAAAPPRLRRSALMAGDGPSAPSGGFSLSLSLSFSLFMKVVPYQFPLLHSSIPFMIPCALAPRSRQVVRGLYPT